MSDHDRDQQEPAAWIGWIRNNRREPWRRVTEGASYSDVWADLAAMTDGSRSVDKLVTRSDRDPNEDR